MTRSTDSAAQPAPSVLVVLVVKDAAEWLRESLTALAAQTYPRLAVMAVDCGSSDGSGQLLIQSLGPRRVETLPSGSALADALTSVRTHPVASAADYLLVLHDDATLDPESVARMVDAAVGLPGVDDVGVVGAKIVDHDEPRRLLDVGRSADRFGHDYSPLQPGEIDQGQFDRVLEVLSVSSAAMLVSRETWSRVGLFDERIGPPHEDLDFCWRARVAGFRVLMTPLARVRHRAESAVADPPRDPGDSVRYEEDRSAIAAMLKNYSWSHLLWTLPLALVLGLVRLVYLLLGRRFEEAFDVVRAWGWNVAHLPGTWSRRRAAQRERRVKDRSLHRFMESAGLRLPRWFETAERILDEQRGIDQDEEVSGPRRLRDRTTSLVATHPVIVGGFLGAIVAAIAMRNLWGSSPLAGGALPSFPASVSGLFGELASAYRTTPLGGAGAASPALGAMGGVSVLTLGSTALGQKAMLGGALPLAAILMYRACVRLTGRAGPSVVAAGAYVLSAVALWAYSQGRISLLVGLAVLPAAAERLEAAFGRDAPSEPRGRFVVGLGVTLAVLVAFLPGAALAVVVLVLIQAVGGARRRRGLARALESIGVAILLLFPFVLTLAGGRAVAFASAIGTTDVRALLRFAFGPGPGTWVVAGFLPVASLIAFSLVDAAHRGAAIRAMAAVLAGLGLSWLSAAGYLPRPVSDPVAFGAMAVVGEVFLIAFGLSSAVARIGREAFGLRQIEVAALAGVLAIGILLQCVAAMIGGWAVGGPQAVPAAWAVVSSGARGEFRVLWIGTPDGAPFPAPGGDPEGVVPAGDATLAYAVTDRGGVTILDTGRPLAGAGGQALRDTVAEVLSGETVHGGALLAPFGIRYVVADPGAISPAASAILGDQVDLDLVPATGLAIYRDASALPPAAVLRVRDPAPILAGRIADAAALGGIDATPMRQVSGGWDGPDADGLVSIATEFSGHWQVVGSPQPPQRAFGWATAFTDTSGPVQVRYGAQWVRTVEIAILALLWAAALWITRKPVRR
jgi:GT2 family glycosyltransferase